MSLFNLRAEFLGVRLEAGDASDIKVAKNAPPSLFDIPETKLSEILSYSPTPYNGHAKKVRGTVTFVASDEVFFMQDEQRGIKVESSAAENTRRRSGMPSKSRASRFPSAASANSTAPYAGQSGGNVSRIQST